MCGIAGIVKKDNRVVLRDEVQKMTDVIQHRGPDAQGQWVENNIGLGHRRLSIIDLSPESNQPMASSDERYWITYNGEIYNYLEIRKELENKGVIFRTAGDTEVILESYKAFGSECLKMFNGMWAFCIYDKEKQQLFMSRDRFGIKPLYYLNDEEMFLFGSEAKTITEILPEQNIPDYVSVYRFIINDQENVDERSFYKNIKIFPAAHYMVYDLNNHKTECTSFWEVDEALFYQKWIQGKHPLKTFKDLFDSAIELRLRADVEVGACLSGGLDSSAIVGCCTKKFGRKMHTFSSIYHDKDCNEEEYIREVNDFCDTIQHSVTPDLEEKNFIQYTQAINYYHDGPTKGASLFSQYMVMKTVHGKVKVILDGQGADEMFAGYIPYYSHYIRDLAEKKSINARLRAIKALAIVRSEWPELLGAISTDVIVSLVGDQNVNYFQNKGSFETNKFRRSFPLLNSDFLDIKDDQSSINHVVLSTTLKSQLCNDILVNSIPSLLHNEDSNSMAFSIESRIPFLDYRLVEFSIALNERYKLKNEWTKWIIRKSCKKYLPPKVYKRKNKMGFPAPFSRWLREGESKEEIKEILWSFCDRNIVPAETVQKFYEAHMSEKVDMSATLYKYYSLELWLRTCNVSNRYVAEEIKQ